MGTADYEPPKIILVINYMEMNVVFFTYTCSRLFIRLLLIQLNFVMSNSSG